MMSIKGIIQNVLVSLHAQSVDMKEQAKEIKSRISKSQKDIDQLDNEILLLERQINRLNDQNRDPFYESSRLHILNTRKFDRAAELRMLEHILHLHDLKDGANAINNGLKPFGSRKDLQTAGNELLKEINDQLESLRKN